MLVLPHWSAFSCYHAGQPLEVERVELPSRDHYHEWADACRGEGQSSTPFSYSSRVTEAVLVGTVAGAFQGRKLKWDAAKESFGDPEADALVSSAERKDW